MANISVAKLAEYMKYGLNIYISGEAGTGKTQMLKAAADKMGYQLGYMSAPTLDAYVDLVGIPIAEYDEALKRKALQFIRKGEFEEIEVLFIDELPRGELKTLNAVFELIQFGTLNGEVALPKLKCVVAAGNPLTDSYTGQQQLDAALLDRFDMYLETDTAADPAYFINVFGKDIGKALSSWHKLHDHKEKGYLSPRRLEKIGNTWLKMPEVGTIKAMVPPGGTFNTDLLHKALKDSVKGSQTKNVDPSAPINRRIPYMTPDEIRENRKEVLDALPTMTRAEAAVATESIARALKSGIRAATVIRDWRDALEYFSPADKTAMMANWPASRNSDFLKAAQDAGVTFGGKLKSLT